MIWKKKRKGSAIVYTAPNINRAIVDRRGFGSPPYITFNGISFDTVDQAKSYAENEYKND